MGGGKWADFSELKKVWKPKIKAKEPSMTRAKRAV
jgi:hypothetical protein